MKPLPRPSSLDSLTSQPPTFRRATLIAVERYRRRRPWSGSAVERVEKLRGLHRDLCEVYGVEARLVVEDLDGSGSELRSRYVPSTLTIHLCGRLSVVTYLHEFAHALGKGERGAIRWSVGLFRRCFPEQFARCSVQGGYLLRAHVARRT